METQGTFALQINGFSPEDRKVLERVALERVCPCLYYDLADYMSETSDDELIAIIEGEISCNDCGDN
jgi:hypothetical protein